MRSRLLHATLLLWIFVTLLLLLPSAVFAWDGDPAGEVAWASSQVGNTGWYTPGGIWWESIDPDGDRWCAKFVGNAFGAEYAGGNAVDLKAEMISAGNFSSTALTSAPVGALVFFNLSVWGHVGIHVGAGQVVHAGVSETVLKDYYTTIGAYAGWAYPPPSRWPGRPDPSHSHTVLIIDSSGSMSWNDPTGLRIQAAKQFIDQAEYGDAIAVVDFDSYGRIIAPLRQVKTDADRVALKQAVDTIDSSGGTDIGAALNVGYSALTGAGVPDKPAAILLTDGDGGYTNQVEQYKTAGIPIYTIGLGSGPNATLLSMLATATGGKYFASPAAEDLADILAQIWGAIHGSYCLLQEQLVMEEGQVSLFSFVKSVVSSGLQFVLTWPGSDFEMTITSPSGQVYGPDTPGIYYAKGATYEIYKIPYAETGEWQVSVEGLDVPDGGELVSLRVEQYTASGGGSAPEVGVSPAEQTVQYSDLSAAIDVDAYDLDGPQLDLSASGLPADIVRVGATSSTDPSGRIDVSEVYQGLLSAPSGSYSATFTASDGTAQASAVHTIVVTPEDATVTSIESPIGVVVPLGGTGSPTITGTVAQADDGSLGDLGLAKVEVSLVPIAPGETFTKTVPVYAGAGELGGSFAASFTGIPVNCYSIVTHVKGDYFTSPVLEDLVTVYCPDAGYATGGGWFYWPGTTDKTSFGFVTDYVKGKKKTLDFKGSLIMIRHTEDGGYHLKSNTYTGLAIGEVTGVEPYGWCAIAGRATYALPGGLPFGNHTFQFYVEDRNEPGTGTDRIWVKLLDGSGSVVAPLTISSTSAGAVPLNGGNIVVPHSTSMK